MQTIFVPRTGGALDFQVDTITVNGLQPARLLTGKIGFFGQQQLPHFALAGGRQHNQAVMKLFQPLGFDQRPAPVLVGLPGAADQQGEILVALLILNQKRQLGRLVDMRAFHPQIRPHQRLDARLHGGGVELDHGKQVGVVCHRHRRDGLAGTGLDQFLDPHHPVHQGIIGVQAQVDKTGVTQWGVPQSFCIRVMRRYARGLRQASVPRILATGPKERRC